MGEKINLSLYPAQDDFVYDETRFTAFIGGIGSGKTFAGCTKALLKCKRSGLGLVVAPTYKMLKDATIRTFIEVAGPMWRDFNKSEMVAVVGNAEILFRSSDKPERLRGPNISWAFFDEAALSDAMTWRILIGRLRAEGEAGPAWITTTPKGRNWVWKEFIEQQRSEYVAHRARTDQNPYLADAYIDDLKAAYHGKFAAQELRGEFVAFEGLIYDEFHRDIHITEREGPWNRIIIGADEGYTNPAVLLVVGEDNDGRVHVLDEFYERRVLQANVVSKCEELWKEFGPETIQVDPSAAGLIAEMQTTGLPAVGANNAVRDGIQSVKNRFVVAGDGKPRLTIDPSCVHTISELESYAWKETRGTMKDEPEKMNDHAMDSLRYAILYLDDPRLYFG